MLRSGARGFFTFSYTVGGPCGSSTFKAYGLRITPPDEYAHLLLRRPAFTVCAVRIGGPPTVSAVRRALDVKTATVSVAFVRGEQLVDVRRTGHSAADATARLITGLTRAETAAAFRTYIPAGTVVHRLSSRGGLATVDMGSRFVAGRSEEELTAEVSQLVQTLSAFAPRVQILVDGQRVERTVGGIPLARPISLSQLKTPNVPLPQAPAVRPRAPDPVTLKAQKRLIELGYLAPGDADGRFGPTTSAGVIAFQKLQRLTRSGSIDTPTATALVSATRPTPVSQGGAGKRAEILLDRQAALLIENNRVVRAISVSTGKTSTPTPPGSYRVYAKIPRWWSTPFREWLPWALPFVGGIAFHQYSVVPAYPASHGCVRQPFSVARWTYDFAEVGMPVRVLAHS